MKKKYFLKSCLISWFILILLPGFGCAQQFVSWTNLQNITNSNNTITKTSGVNGWNAGAESLNKLAFGMDGWVEFTISEITSIKALGISYEPSSSVLKDSIKYGFIFTFDGSTRRLKTKKLSDTSFFSTYNANDVFRIEKVGTKIYFLKNTTKIDSASLASNNYSFFIDASIFTLNGAFSGVRTSFPLTSNVTVNPNKDAFVQSLSPTYNGGSNVYLMASRQTNGGYNTLRSFIEFDVSSIPKNAKIVSSKMYLYGVDGDTPTPVGHRCNSYCTGNASKLHLNTSTWDESLVTYNSMPGYDTNTFAVIPATAMGMYIYTDFVVETRNLVQKWVDGSKTNYGMTHRVDNESVVYTVKQFRSSDHTNTAERPRVEIEYYLGTKYYVNDNSTSGDMFCKVTGSSANTGLSPYSPKNSVTSILSSYVLGAKDTIFVDCGNFTEAITIGTADMGTTSGDMVLLGAGKNKTIFTAPSTSHNLNLTSVSYITVENIAFVSSQTGKYNNYIYNCSNVKIKSDSVFHSANGNIYIYDCSNVLLDGNSLISSKTDSKGIEIFGNSSIIQVTENWITNQNHKTIGVQLTPNSKSLVCPSNVTISNNVIDIDSIGVLCAGLSSAKVDDLNLENNTISIFCTNSLSCGIKVDFSGSSSSVIDTISGNTIIGGGYGIKAFNFKYSKVYNNYLLNNKIGISLTSAQDNLFAYNSFYNTQTNFYGTTSDVPTNTTLSNNIFVSIGNSSYYNLNLVSGSFTSCDYNCYFNPNGAGVAVHGGLQYTSLSSWQGTDHYSGTGNGDEHSISADPLYPNPITDDLDIDLLSPCTQAGSAVSGITTDIYNRLRRSLPSIGANEPILFLNIPVLKNSILTDEDTVVATLTGSGIDTTFIVPDTFLVYPTVPLEGYLNYEISFEGDTSLIDDSSIGFRVNSLGKIDSVYEKSGTTQNPLDPAYYTLFNLSRGIAPSAIMVIIPYYGILSEKPDGGFINTPGKRLRFYYQEEYNVDDDNNDPGNNKALEYNIYNSAMSVVASVDKDGNPSPAASPKFFISDGQNRVTLKLDGLSMSTPAYYLLEVINEKGEKWYLRFRY